MLPPRPRGVDPPAPGKLSAEVHILLAPCCPFTLQDWVPVVTVQAAGIAPPDTATWLAVAALEIPGKPLGQLRSAPKVTGVPFVTPVPVVAAGAAIPPTVTDAPICAAVS